MAKNFKDYLRKKRRRLFHSQHGLCYYCGEPMLLAKVPEGMRQPSTLATLDHLIPRSRGGTFCNNNVVAACKRCNTERGDKDARLFLLKRRGMA